MRHTTNININECNNLLNDAEDAKFLMLLCKEKPYLIIKTEFGLGKYKFRSIGVDKTKLLIKYQLITDQGFQDSDKISYYLGKFCYFNAEQFLYACKYYAIA